MTKPILLLFLLSAAVAAAAPTRIDYVSVIDVQADSGASLTDTAATAEAALSTGQAAQAAADAAMSAGTAARAVADAAVPKSGGTATNLTASGWLSVGSPYPVVSGADAGDYAGAYQYAGTWAWYDGDEPYYTNTAGRVLTKDVEYYYAGGWVLCASLGSITYFETGGAWQDTGWSGVDIVMTGTPREAIPDGTLLSTKVLSEIVESFGLPLQSHAHPTWTGQWTNYNGRAAWAKTFGDIRYNLEFGYALSSPNPWGAPQQEYVAMIIAPEPYSDRYQTIHFGIENGYANAYIGFVPNNGSARDWNNIRCRYNTATIGNTTDDTGVRLKVAGKLMADVILVGTNLTADPSPATYPQLYSINLGGTNRVLRAMDQLGNINPLTPELPSGRVGVMLDYNVHRDTRRYVTAENFEAWFRAVSEKAGLDPDQFITVEAHPPQESP